MTRATRVLQRILRLAALACLASPSLPAWAQAPAPASTQGPAQAQPLADGVFWLPGRFERARQPDGNSLLLRGETGLVIVDSGRHIEHAQALLHWVRTQHRPLQTVINTHWHLDHLGGNAVLRDAHPGLTRLASPALVAALQQDMPRSEAEYRGMLQDPKLDATTRRMVEIDLALYARRPALAPGEVVSAPSEDRVVAGRQLRIGVDRGPTRGDLWVLDLESSVLAVGDFVTLPVPFFDTACAADWRQALGRIDALPFDRLVPGHGSPMSRGEFGRWRRAFEQLIDCAAGTEAPPVCSRGWIEGLGPMLPATDHAPVQPMLTHYITERLRSADAVRQSCGR